MEIFFEALIVDIEASCRTFYRRAPFFPEVRIVKWERSLLLPKYYAAS